MFVLVSSFYLVSLINVCIARKTDTKLLTLRNNLQYKFVGFISEQIEVNLTSQFVAMATSCKPMFQLIMHC